MCVLVPLKWRCPSTKLDVTLKSGPRKDGRRRKKKKEGRVDESRATSALLRPLFLSLSLSLLRPSSEPTCIRLPSLIPDDTRANARESNKYIFIRANCSRPQLFVLITPERLVS